MKTNLGDIGNKAKRTELYRKQKGDKKAQQKERRRRREREAQELGEVGLFLRHARCWRGSSVFVYLTFLCGGLVPRFERTADGRRRECVLASVFCHIVKQDKPGLSITSHLLRRSGSWAGASGPLARTTFFFTLAMDSSSMLHDDRVLDSLVGNDNLLSGHR